MYKETLFPTDDKVYLNKAVKSKTYFENVKILLTFIFPPILKQLII